MGGAVLAAACLLATAYTDSLAVIVGLRLLSGVAEAAFFVASFAALADLAPPSRMGEALSYNSLGLYLGIAFGLPRIPSWGSTPRGC
jgi:predicted MFS family arabinose efflux permease